MSKTHSVTLGNKNLASFREKSYNDFEKQVTSGQMIHPQTGKKIGGLARFALQGPIGLAKGKLNSLGKSVAELKASESTAVAANNMFKSGEISSKDRDEAYKDYLYQTDKFQDKQKASKWGAAIGALLAVAATVAVLTFPPLVAAFAPLASAAGGGLLGSFAVVTAVSLPVSTIATIGFSRGLRKSDEKIMNGVDEKMRNGAGQQLTNAFDTMPQMQRGHSGQAIQSQPLQQQSAPAVDRSNMQDKLIPAKRNAANHQVQGHGPRQSDHSVSIHSGRENQSPMRM